MLRGSQMGHWKRTNWLFGMASFRLRRQIESTLRECANIYYSELIMGIETGMYGMWPSLSKSWASTKGHGEFYRYTGDFISRIRVEMMERGPVNYSIFVGVRDDEIHGSSGKSMGEIADILESRRPLFDPAWYRVEGSIQRKLQDIGGDVLR